WQTGYGKAILVKAALLAAAMVLGGVNYARSAPRVVAAHRRGDQALGTSAVGLLQRLVSVEAVLVAAILLAAMVLSSLPPPARALTEVGRASARVGPGPVSQTVHHGGYTLTLRISPNRAAAPSMFTLHLTRSGRPVTGAGVVAHFAMLDMEMGQQAYTLPETAPGTYQRSAPALVMVGHWGLSFDVEPPGAPPFTVIILDHAEG
ncbi:MAG: FixH family protein, partial [Gaiellales bacterium]